MATTFLNKKKHTLSHLPPTSRRPRAPSSRVVASASSSFQSWESPFLSASLMPTLMNNPIKKGEQSLQLRWTYVNTWANRPLKWRWDSNGRRTTLFSTSPPRRAPSTSRFCHYVWALRQQQSHCWLPETHKLQARRPSWGWVGRSSTLIFHLAFLSLTHHLPSAIVHSLPLSLSLSPS